MSQWEVPDKPTAELMADFYRYVLAGKRRSAALRQAMLDLRDRRLKADEPAQPFYWGGFVLFGDPGGF